MFELYKFSIPCQHGLFTCVCMIEYHWGKTQLTGQMEVSRGHLSTRDSVHIRRDSLRDYSPMHRIGSNSDGKTLFFFDLFSQLFLILRSFLVPGALAAPSTFDSRASRSRAKVTTARCP